MRKKIILSLIFLSLTYQAQNTYASPAFLIAQNDDDFSFDLDSEGFDFSEDDNSEFSGNDDGSILNDDFNFDSEDSSEFGGYESPQDENYDDAFAEEVITEQTVEQDIKTLNAPAVERVQPKETNRHYYIKHPNQEKGLYKISADGKYYYKVKESPKSYGLAIKGGAFLFKDLINPRTGNSFQQVYGTSAKPTLYVEYLLPFFKKKNVPAILKAARLKLGGGLIFANGSGLFGNPDYIGIISPEQYTYIGIPLEVGLQYALEFFDEQIFVPYGAAALSYMLGTEIQDGNFKRTKFLGQLGAHLSGGIAIGLGWLEESAKFDLDAEFGINQAYLTIEFRQNIALQQDFKFTSASIVGGLWLEF